MRHTCFLQRNMTLTRWIYEYSYVLKHYTNFDKHLKVTSLKRFDGFAARLINSGIDETALELCYHLYTVTSRGLGNPFVTILFLFFCKKKKKITRLTSSAKFSCTRTSSRLHNFFLLKYLFNLDLVQYKRD